MFSFYRCTLAVSFQSILRICRLSNIFKNVFPGINQRNVLLSQFESSSQNLEGVEAKNLFKLFKPGHLSQNDAAPEFIKTIFM